QISSDLATLKSSVAHVTVASDPPGAEILDARVPVRGERVLNAYGPLAAPTKLGLRQGTHQITAKLASYPDQTWEVEIVGGRDLPEHKFVFTKAAVPQAAAVPQPAAVSPATAPAPVYARPVPTGVWIGAAATGAFAVATVVTGVLAMGKHSDFQTANNGQDPANAQSIKDSGQTINLVSDVTLGAAVVTAGVTAALYFMRPTVEVAAGSSSASRSASVAVVPEVGLSRAGLSLKGEF
ncbi:MAG: hypothetical protein ACREJ3_04875, partial [Polyangiaceae bacterium]